MPEKAYLGFIDIGQSWAVRKLGVLSYSLERRKFMSVYSVKGKGWRWEFMKNGQRYAKGFYQTKKEARKAMETAKEVLAMGNQENLPPTDTNFFELVQFRLDDLEAYCTEKHYGDVRSLAKRWVRKWGKLPCSQITPAMIQRYILKRRSDTSSYTARKDLKQLRAAFNFGKRKKLTPVNPAEEVSMIPVEKKIKQVPSQENIDKVILMAESDSWLQKHFPDTPAYLWVIRDTFCRSVEVNRLEWKDVNFERNYLVLYTRKKKGSDLTPRKVAMTQRLRMILWRRFENRDASKPWVFWNPRTGKPYKERSKFMRRLCKKAGVDYFRFHPMRHSGASLLEQSGAPVTSIQKILGHENRTTTEIYLHSMEKSEAEAIATFENFSHTNSHTLVEFPKSENQHKAVSVDI